MIALRATAINDAVVAVSVNGSYRLTPSSRLVSVRGCNLKVKPFVVGATSKVRGSRADDYDGGFDAKYSLTPSMTLDATYRTDFAQVEVDQQQVNLTRFNVFFPEKREFFLENSGVFSFGPGSSTSGGADLVPFFSRRIGLSEAGTPIPIVGGGRVSGKGSNYDAGVLAMRTNRTASTPANNYVVARVRRDLLRNSWIGAIATGRDSAQGSDFNRVYGADAHFLFYDRLELESYWLGSQTGGIALSPGQDQARRFSTAWRDDELTIAAEYNTVQPNFNPEVGFVRRKDVTQYSGDVTWLPLVERSPRIRNFIVGGTVGLLPGRQQPHARDANADRGSRHPV